MQVVGRAQTELVRTRVVRLDDDLPSDYLPHLIKIDVNGGEELVFRGAAAI